MFFHGTDSLEKIKGKQIGLWQVVTQQLSWVGSVTFIIHIFLSWFPCTSYTMHYTSYLIFHSQVLFSRPQLNLFLLNNIFLLVLPKMDLFAATFLLHGTLLTRPVQTVLFARLKKKKKKYINKEEKEPSSSAFPPQSYLLYIFIHSFPLNFPQLVTVLQK